MVYCGQTAGWLTMRLDREVGLGPGDVVLDGTQLPHRTEHSGPHFSAHVYCGQTVCNTRLYKRSGQHVLTKDHTDLPATHMFIHNWNEPSCLYPQPQSVTALWSGHFSPRVR